jgi:hypothetical protein
MGQNKRNKIIVMSVIALLVLCLIFLLFSGKKKNKPAPEEFPLQHKQKESTIVSTDSVKNPFAGHPSPHTAVKHHPVLRESTTLQSNQGVDTAEGTDTTADTSDQAAAKPAFSRCAGDTAAPWVYPDPSGGLHHAEIRVTFASTKPCVIEWKADSAAPWIVYKGDSIPVKTTMILYFRGSDSCGNRMAAREESYEIRPEETGKYCPDGMEYVSAGASRFCIDRYEWPNKKGAVPRSFISLYQATDSCVSVRKHLCNSDEWTLACTGPYGWRYPYGAAYESHACVTQDTAARPSGTKAECRGYFGVFDMAGNLAEWTNTRSNKNPQFFNVKGGFWESGPRSGCFDVRYSYYPQNRHNPVGFRCCKEALP